MTLMRCQEKYRLCEKTDFFKIEPVLRGLRVFFSMSNPLFKADAYGAELACTA